MRAYKCDRCGKLYEFLGSIDTGIPIRINDMDVNADIIERSTIIKPSRSIDLCPDCEASFTHWFAHPEVVPFFRDFTEKLETTDEEV